MEEKNKVQGSTLYLVGTPIGNLSDLTERARKVLSEVDFIAAEDTRNSMRLLSAIGIRSELISYHEHNKRSSGEKIVARLLSGESCALITDAGMPAISDPGEDLARLAKEAGLTVTTVPGPTALISALSLSGLPTARFCFEGFLAAKGSERKKQLTALEREERTMIFYEAPHKLRATLSDMLSAFGADRKISLCRELTKLNEEICQITLGEAIKLYEEREPRGEYVLVVAGAEIRSTQTYSLLSISPEEHVRLYTDDGMSKMDAIKKAARERGIPKSELYKMLVDKD